MILVGIPAKITCDEPGCTAFMGARLCLLAVGTFGFQPSEQGWQLLASSNGPATPLENRCPKHHRKLNMIQAIPDAPRRTQ